MVSSSTQQKTRNGLAAALTAYCIWGILPLYWKALQAVPSYEIICHRIVWSLLLTLVLLFFQGKHKVLRQALTNKKILFTFLGASTEAW